MPTLCKSIQSLTKLGIDVNLEKALFKAIEENKPHLIHTLCSTLGANPNVTIEEALKYTNLADNVTQQMQKLPLIAYAMQKNRITAVQMMLKNGAEPEPALRQAILADNANAVAILTQLGVDRNGMAYPGTRWMSLAIDAKAYKSMEILFKRGFQLFSEQGQEFHYKDNPYVHALYKQDFKSFLFFFNKKVPINESLLTNGNETLLHVAFSSDNIPFLRQFLKFNQSHHLLDINVKDAKQQTAGYDCAFLGKIEALTLLQQYGLNLLSTDKDGKTVFDIIKESPFFPYGKEAALLRKISRSTSAQKQTAPQKGALRHAKRAAIKAAKRKSKERISATEQARRETARQSSREEKKPFYPVPKPRVLFHQPKLPVVKLKGSIRHREKTAS